MWKVGLIMKKTIYLHIGFPKTGTSTVQSFLNRNKDLLKEKGLFYPTDGKYFYKTAHHSLYFAMNFCPDNIEDEYRKTSDELWSDLKNDIDSSNEENIIISCENFMLINPEDIYRYLKNYNIKIISYIRDPKVHFESWYKECIRGVSSFIPTLKKESLDLAINYYIKTFNIRKVLDKYLNVFGLENIIVRIFDRKYFYKNDLISDFLKIFNIDHSDLFVKISNVNKSISCDALEYKAIINSLISDKTELSFFNNDFRGIAGNLIGEANSLIDSKILKKIDDEFAEDYDYIAENYLSMPAKSLFNMNSKNMDSNYDGLTLEKSIKFSLDLWRYMHLKELDNKIKNEVVISDYIKKNASDYHYFNINNLLKKVYVKNKKIMEIGSDYHLISARLLKAHGARQVVATNLSYWKSDEPLPQGVSFKQVDASKKNFDENSFDIIFGVAIIEHIMDFEKMLLEIKRILKKDGVVYLQGSPLWTSSKGHHVWYITPDHEYKFIDDKTPIDPWSHLVLSTDEFKSNLMNKDVSEDDADGIINYIYNLDGKMTGSSSNMISTTEIIGVMKKYFKVDMNLIKDHTPKNRFYKQALLKYNKVDLETVGIEFFLRNK